MSGMRTDTDVVITGAGPTGLMLACELRLAGVDVVVVDRLAGRTGESRAGGMHARTLEVLDQRGVLDRFLAAGVPRSIGHFSGLWLDFGRFDTRYTRSLMLLQSRIERLLEEWAGELGVRVRRSSEVTALRQDGDGVEVALGGPGAVPSALRARYLVGCDGGRSTVRRLAGIGFPGTEATLTALLGDVELADPPAEPVFMRRRAGGDFSVLGFEPGWYRVITTEHGRVAPAGSPATLEELRESLLRIAGTDFGMHSPRWVSRFGDAARQAERYREGRVLLAGDAAHIHFPSGGQGLNLGVQDAVNLGWKLASVVHGRAPDTLLDSYHAERYPVAERVLHNTRAQSALSRPGPQTDALRDVLRSLIGYDDVNRHLGGMITALDVGYDLGGGHPLTGLRVPDADLETADGPARVFGLLHAARPVLLDLRGGGETAAAAAGWADRVDVVEATSVAGHWPVWPDGGTPAPDALLIRPDGHVAWAASPGAGGLDTGALRTALTTWCGPATAKE
ncbi:putative monooxygenase [Streptomyces capillispiralis]|uniref:3-(3-hydroxy-phenyl)propionate hydroxylase n=2 Tax=Streptomyces capillispiralis TaxID=68182 RepID=A0A561TGG0_9ACTN|nr:3-(3-hydroxy-phenyl)propionate hydroxylase [Streptomyces capillispiralis]GHH91127.1 putative monooxygenase [Streptomyces capillispiralis]